MDMTDLEGAWVASDMVDTTTGEVLLEANSELTADKVSKILDSGVVELNVFFPVPLAAGKAQEDETILVIGCSSHVDRRFVHLDPPRLIGSP